MIAIGEAANTARANGYGRLTGSKVHRNTRHRPGEEGGHWRPVSRGFAGRLMLAAERYERRYRLRHREEKSGKKNGAIGHIGLTVLREMLRLVDRKTGRLDPAVATLAGRIGHSIAAVHAAIGRLREHGFLTWIRRYVPTGRDGLRGPQVRQTSNAYALIIPAGLDEGAPLPDDERWRRAQAAADAAEMLDKLDLFERNRALGCSDGLGAALDRLMRALDASEKPAA